MMDALIVKLLAVGLTLSQVFTQSPDQFQEHFDPHTDQARVTELLTQGCHYFVNEFKADKIDFDVLLTLMAARIQEQKEQAAKNPGQEVKKSYTDRMLEQLDLPSLHAAYKMFCKGEKLEDSPIRLDEAIAFYNQAFKTLPDASELKGKKLLETSVVLDGDEQKFTEVYADDNRRRYVSIHELPPYVKQAFISAEDQRFESHAGIDIRGVTRAFIKNLTAKEDPKTGKKPRPEGGSTITQQVVKNMLLNNDVTFERKMAEMVLSKRVENILSKDEILEYYLNFIYFGRASWGIEMAAQSYFGKSAKKLTLAEAALLAGLVKGPNEFHTERNPEGAKARRQYVLGRIREDMLAKKDTSLSKEDFEKAMAQELGTIPYDPPRTRGAFFFLSEINREAKRVAKIPSLTSGSFTVHSTLNPRLQEAAEYALQKGLFDYEAASGRSRLTKPEGSLNKRMKDENSTWQEAIIRAQPALFDSKFELATVVELGKSVKVGLKDGRVLPLKTGRVKMEAKLKKFDLVRVEVTGKKSLVAELRPPSKVQGAVIVIENKTGRVLAMSGGNSYALTQLNRATQTVRQPGSTLKPFIYLAALNLGYQPNTLIPNVGIKFAPIHRGGHSWRPKNYSARAPGLVSIRYAIEQSLNIPTARMMAAMDERAPVALDYIRALTQKLGIYEKTERFYPFILGAQPTRLIDMAVAYATIANDGLKPTPHFIDLITEAGKPLYERPRFGLEKPKDIDRVAFFQIRKILEGTLERGTARRMKDLAGIVAGKTGTSNIETDAWFAGFTNDITVAAWVGYDNDNGRTTLGGGYTGGSVALPIAESVFRKSFEVYAPARPLTGIKEVDKEIADQVVVWPIHFNSGEFGGDFEEFFRKGPDGRPSNTRTHLLKTERHYSLLNELEQSVARGRPQLPLGEESEPEQMAMLNPEDDIFGGYQLPVEPNDFWPGAEDMNEVWSRSGRRVDPLFAEPSFYNE